MPVDGVGGSTAAQLMYNRNDVAGTSEELTMTDFYKLMAAQMQYQDPDNPMDTSELMAQMVQSKMITAIAQMTSISTTSYWEIIRSYMWTESCIPCRRLCL